MYWFVFIERGMLTCLKYNKTVLISAPFRDPNYFWYFMEQLKALDWYHLGESDLPAHLNWALKIWIPGLCVPKTLLREQ